MDWGNTFSAISISATGLRAERIRMNVVADNIANANTTRTPEGGPFRRKEVIFASLLSKPSVGRIGTGAGVRVVDIVPTSDPPKMIFNPGHPDANKQGYLALPNINIISEMVDMISATRSYEANVAAIKAAKSIIYKVLEIGGR